ncbi:MAG: peptidase M42 [Chloroflexi bacterium RBG_16_48_8]|nr:MAG: peptidase M42 [Chloroflexi bacterium RBG_16_48_8]
MTQIDSQYLKERLANLLEIPSPTGFTEQATQSIADSLEKLGLKPNPSLKGGLTAEFNGESDMSPRALTAHVDTLGAMVKEVKPNGRLRLTKVGGFAWNTVEGESCRIFTRHGKVILGSLLIEHASGHIYGEGVGKIEREDANMEVRIDELTTSAEETRAMGIESGDFVAFDPRMVISENGFIRSRHLDDKAGVACVLSAVKAMSDSRIVPTQRTTLHFSNYEEVGHGATSGFPPDLTELVAVDMAVVGEGQNSDEFHTTICAKDNKGPYHYTLTKHLQDIAESAGIPYKVDIYPFYGSDGEAYWRAGGDVRVALIGPGVDASHNYERTHMDALIATCQLIVVYLMS